ncbi:MAG TPA: SPOR domain-containing protein [Candidatus Acidoferrales bacterium]|nr:SPOR domain-containing protein [Candidatus Acidoferrales bacterium]
MAGGGKRGGDRVLESRHLVGLFLGVVLLCGVFFTLGYVMGHSVYGRPVHAADALDRGVAVVRTPAKSSEREAAPAPSSSEWDFYSKNSDNRLEPAATPSSPSATPAPVASAHPTTTPAAPSEAHTVPTSARFQAPRLPKGAIVLQVAALRHESDALAMADALQQKNFPSFVVTPATDSFYRVQVGPYSDEHAADSARAALDHAGFKAILKH